MHAHPPSPATRSATRKLTCNPQLQHDPAATKPASGVSRRAKCPRDAASNSWFLFSSRGTARARGKAAISAKCKSLSCGHYLRVDVGSEAGEECVYTRALQCLHEQAGRVLAFPPPSLPLPLGYRRGTAPRDRNDTTNTEVDVDVTARSLPPASCLLASAHRPTSIHPRRPHR